MTISENHPTAAFELVVFDWDGTIFDSTAHIAHCIQRAVEDVGGATPSLEQAKYVIGLGLKQALAHVAPDVPASKHEELSRRYLYHYARDKEEITLFDGIESLLQTLKARGIKLAVATGKSRRGLDEALTESGIGNYFQTTRTADETRGKPHPQMLFEILEELDCAAERTVMIGDTNHDLQLAENAGCASIAVSYGAHDPHRFDAHAPLCVAHSVAELETYLLQTVK